jgi:hypothetical protein
MTKYVRLIFFVCCVLCISFAQKTVLGNSLLSESDYDSLFKILIEQCGQQQRKACYDTNGAISCYHLVECNNIYAFSSTCGSCLLGPGNYWCSIDSSLGNTSSICTNSKEVCEFAGMVAISSNSNCPYGIYHQLDCNFNGIDDSVEITMYPYIDSNLNGVIDECEVDCNGNGVYDYIDITSGNSRDLNDNHVPDECDPDCNSNTIPDEIDILYKMSKDANSNMIPDECESPSPSPSSPPSNSPSPSPSPIIPSQDPEPSPSPSNSPSSAPSQDPEPLPSITPSSSPIPFESQTCGDLNCENGHCDTIDNRCICDSGWIGRKCEISDCNYKGIYNMLSQLCNCYPGWDGVRCNQCASSIDSHPDKIFLCCPSYGQLNSYMMVLVPESKKQDYLNGIYSNSKCEYQNTTFPNSDRLDCACKFTEGTSRMSEEKLELRQQIHGISVDKFSIKNTILNVIESNGQIDYETYSLASLTVYQGMVMEELMQNYPIQLANAMAESVVSFAEDSSDTTETVGIIVFSVVAVIVVIIGVTLFIFVVLSSRTKTYKEKDKSTKSIKSRSKIRRIV